MSSQHAPYAPTVWSLGGKPTVGVDVPITAVFLFLFICGAVTHMTIYQKNNRRGHKFLFNGLMFGFCMARITTCTIRIASISLPKDIPLSIAAQIFTAAGVVLFYVINLFFTQRIIRAQHPHLGWHKLFAAFFYAVFGIIVVSLVMLITAVVQSSYTLRPRTHFIDRAIQLYGVTLFAVVSFLPVLLLAISLIIPRRSPVDKFGTGRLRHNIAIVLLGSLIIALGACYRCGTSWKTPVPMTKPLPVYFERVRFYIFNFMLEIIVVAFYALVRVDQRFHVPDGAKGPGSYTQGRIAKQQDVEKQVADGPQDAAHEEADVDDDVTIGARSAGSLRSLEPEREKKAEGALGAKGEDRV